MPLGRMNDFRVAIDPRTGELRSSLRPFRGHRGLRGRGSGFNWRPLAIGSAIVLALLVAVFLAAVVSELM